MPRNTIPSVQVGDKYGLWTVLELNVAWGGAKQNHAKDLVRCECGEEREVQRGNYKAGRSQSCGQWPCYLKVPGAKKRGNPAWQSHGLSSDPIHRVWRNMRQRCRPDHKLSEYYYDRGIRVWPEWEDFKTFYGYVMGTLGPRPEGATLDRIDNDRGYEPGNIRWATRKQQNNNKRPKAKAKRPKWSSAYKRNGPAGEPPKDRVRPVHVPPHLAKKGWTS